MKQVVLNFVLLLLFAPVAVTAQTSPSATGAPEGGTQSAPANTVGAAAPKPFSRLALGGGIGLGGINLQAAVEANRYLNIRGIGNVFSYSVKNININGSGGGSGVDVSGTLNFAEAGVALDYYPWPNHGFRLSPGLTFYNENGATASGTTTPGASITLNSTTYYSDSVNPFALNASLGLNQHKQAFTLTTGWGNMLSRKGGHWSFPFEIGAIFTGTPVVKLNLTGNACTNPADAATNGPSCVNLATNATAQADIASQVAKFRNDLNALTVYPVLTFGVSYNFRIR